jgi:PAS domain S-box-containing protein
MSDDPSQDSGPERYPSNPITSGKHSSAEPKTSHPVFENGHDRYSRIFHGSKDAMAFADLGGVLLEVNEAFCGLTGYSRKELLNHRKYQDITPAEYHEMERSMVERLLRTQKAIEFEKEYIRKDGSRVPVSLTVFLVRAAGGRPIGLAGIIKNLSDYRGIENSLRESERKFRTLAETIPQVVWTCSADGRAEYFNGHWYDYTGLTESESLICGWYGIVHPDDLERVGSLWQHSIGTGATYDGENLLRARDGTYRWHLVRAEPLRDESGGILQWFGTCTNIDDVKKAEETLLRQAAAVRLLEAVATASNEAQTAEQAIRESLDAICEYAGWPVGHAYLLKTDGTAGFVTTAAWHLSDEERFAEFRRVTKTIEIDAQRSLPGRILNAGTLVSISDLAEDNHFIRKDAARSAGLSAGFGFPVWAGRDVVAVLEFFSDKPIEINEALVQVMTNVGTQLGRVFERTRAEKSLRRLSANLLRSQDDERRRIARELHDSAGQYFAVLTMNLQALKQQIAGLKPEESEILSESIEVAERCSKEIRTVSYLLHPPLLDELGLESAVRWYVEGFAKRTNIQVDLELSPDLGRLPGDIEIVLFRIVQEALTNIVRHSGSSTARIKICKDSNGTSVEVSDTGRGMPAHLVGNRRGPSGQTGVGIAGMRERVEELGGELDIQSGTNGTTVRATIAGL